jgi:hypothetical protein
MSAVATETEIHELVVRLSSARAKGADWLVSRLADDGEPVGAKANNHYYRVPWALAIAGRVEEGARALAWIERNALTDKGDLRPGAPQTNWNNVGWTRDAASYPLAIMATGAWHLERYDTALAIMDTLEAFQDPETGGGFVERPELRATGKQDLLCTAQLGLTGLVTGRRAVADAAFGWLERFMAAQPELPGRLYLCWGKDGLITNVQPEQALGHVVDFAKPRQTFFNPGIGAAFMGRYYMATRSEAARSMGRRFVELSDAGTERQYEYWDTVHVGKVAWGSGSMLDVDADDLYLKNAVRMGKWLIDSQSEDGRWNPTHFQTPDPTDSDALWKTGEHIMLSSIVLAALAAYPRAR